MFYSNARLANATYKFWLLKFILFRLGRCQTCQVNDGKYRCPGCEFVSCSLDCVKMHKKEKSCDGVRNKSKFVPINKFSELDLLSGKVPLVVTWAHL